MSRQIQIRRGTAAEHENFTGKIGEITMDTTNNTIRVHDGQTPGGTILAKQSEIPQQQTLPDNYDFVVESQMPTAANNYTWYRKYKSGWVEQGGKYSTRNSQITLPVVFVDANYNVLLSFITNSSNSCQYNSFAYTDVTPNGFLIINSGSITGSWRAEGFCI